MLFPLRTDIPLARRPWANYFVIVANIACAVLASRFPSLATTYEFNVRDPHLLNFISYAFLHQPGSIIPWLSLHLVGNVVALAMFGPNVNDRLGHVGYLSLYLAGAIFAATGCVLLPGAMPRVIGASGAVMTITAAYLVFFPRSHVILMFVLVVANGVIEVPCLYLVSLVAALHVARNLTGATGVADTAHLWGALLGFVVAMALLQSRLLAREQFDLLSILQRWHRRRQYQSLVAAGYDPFNAPAKIRPRRPSYAPVYNPMLDRIKELRAQVHEAIAHHNLPHAAIVFLELKKLDPDQVLSRQAQLDIANQLASQQFYKEAADAYEHFLNHYPNYPRIEHVQLMLAVICSRHLNRKARATELLNLATPRLHNQKDIQLAHEEMRALSTSPSQQGR